MAGPRAFLVALGAKIEGIGTSTIVVHGPATLGGARYAIQPDHIEVGSLIGLAAVTRSPLRIARAGVEHLRSIRMGFERLGIVCGVRRRPRGALRPTMKIHDDFGGHVPKLEDSPARFPADLMSIAIVTATQCDGAS
jgi:UDP-N-acetylglucosamine 1-carboxyvinyltransferase